MLTLLAIIVPLLVGAGAWFAAPKIVTAYRDAGYFRVEPVEFAATAAIVVLVAVLVTVVWGPSAAQAHAAAGYREFWNGSLISATTTDWACTRDGPCTHEYRCDPYEVEDRHYDSKGNYTHSTYHTEYHACPYTTHETSYLVNDNLGRTTTIGAHHIDANPRPFRRESIPGDLPRGEPPRWVQFRDNIAAGHADPVTKINTYVNLILPTEGELYKQYSDSVDGYLKAGLLPKHTANLEKDTMFDFGLQARKFQVVGGKPGRLDVGVWNDRLMAFNAALGKERQGDLHIVVLPADKVRNPDDYVNALVSYWQHNLGRWGFPKNGIALVIGTDGGKVVWARAKTGMPEGNGELTAAVSFELKGHPLDADALLGDVTAAVHGEEARYSHGDGVLADIMFREHGFRRACMRHCDDKGDSGTGYVYLKDSLPVSTSAKVLMFVVVLVISLALWGAAVAFDPVGYLTASRRPSTNNRY